MFFHLPLWLLATIVLVVALVAFIIGYMLGSYKEYEEPKYEINRARCRQNLVNASKNKILFFPDETKPCFRNLKYYVGEANSKCINPRCKFSHEESGSPFWTLFNSISSTKKHVDLCMYNLTHEYISKLLIELSRRGKRVRIVTNTICDQPGHDKIPVCLESGIMIKSNHSNSKMHNKFVIVDNKIVVFGSANYSNGGFFHNDEAVVVSLEADIVDKFVKRFDVLWNKYEKHQITSLPVKSESWND